MKIKALAGAALALALGVGVALTPAISSSAHDNKEHSTCRDVSVEFVNFATGKKSNHITVTIDDKVVEDTDFQASFSKTYDIAPNWVSHTYRVVVTAWDSPRYNYDSGVKSTTPCDRDKPDEPVGSETPGSKEIVNCDLDYVPIKHWNDIVSYTFDAETWAWVKHESRVNLPDTRRDKTDAELKACAEVPQPNYYSEASESTDCATKLVTRISIGYKQDQVWNAETHKYELGTAYEIARRITTREATETELKDANCKPADYSIVTKWQKTKVNCGDDYRTEIRHRTLHKFTQAEPGAEWVEKITYKTEGRSFKLTKAEKAALAEKCDKDEPITPVADISGNLPHTGVDLQGPIISMGGALLLGMGLLAFRYRRRLFGKAQHRA